MVLRHNTVLGDDGDDGGLKTEYCLDAFDGALETLQHLNGGLVTLI